MGIMSAIKTPLGAVLFLVVTLILAGLTIASSISGELTADHKLKRFMSGSAVYTKKKFLRFCNRQKRKVHLYVVEPVWSLLS